MPWKGPLQCFITIYRHFQWQTQLRCVLIKLRLPTNIFHFPPRFANRWSSFLIMGEATPIDSQIFSRQRLPGSNSEQTWSAPKSSRNFISLSRPLPFYPHLLLVSRRERFNFVSFLMYGWEEIFLEWKQFSRSVLLFIWAKKRRKRR